MGNLFLGFPVPRAKIADMISGSAPPSLHKTQHQDGGTDEMDVTGLSGAGGISSEYDDPGFFFGTWFESLEGYGLESSPAGGVITDKYSISVMTQGGGTDYARLFRRPAQFVTAPSWAKSAKFKTEVEIYVGTDSLPKVDILWGRVDTGRHFGFVVRSGLLKASVANGSAETLSATIEDWGSVGYDKYKKLEAHYKVSSIDFYVDGVLKATLSTGLPTGTAQANELIYIGIRANGNTQSNTIYASYWKAWKEQ